MLYSFPYTMILMYGQEETVHDFNTSALFLYCTSVQFPGPLPWVGGGGIIGAVLSAAIQLTVLAAVCLLRRKRRRRRTHSQHKM